VVSARGFLAVCMHSLPVAVRNQSACSFSAGGVAECGILKSAVDAPSLEMPKAMDGALTWWGGKPAYSKGVGGRWSIRSLPTQVIL